MKINKKDLSENSWIVRFILYGVVVIFFLVLIYYVKLSQVGVQNQPQNQSESQTEAAPPEQIIPAAFAFPGAEGFGSSTPGGRYGQIVFVSNLNDTTDVTSPDYEGSLRWALEQSLPKNSTDPYSQRRIVVFKVGGVISLVDQLTLMHPFVTIAGQTAPGDGIVLTGNTMVISTHDVIVRGIRIRVGDLGGPTCCLDGINISTHNAIGDVYNVIIDHSSVSWAIDENLSTWIDPERPYTARDITIQWSVISEGLHNSVHIDEGATTTDPHSMGAILGQDGTNMTVHHNIFAHNWARNPRISGIINSEIINNVIYDWGNAAVEINKDKNITHILNNYFRAGLTSRHEEISLSNTMHPESQVYISGNLTYDPRDSIRFLKPRFELPENFTVSRKLLFAPSDVTMTPAKTAYELVLNFAGAISPVRDEVDQRIVDEVRNGNGEIIDSQDQVRGWPTYRGSVYPEDNDNDGIPNEWEIAHGINPDFAGDANSNNFLAPSGYTWVEEYINSMIVFTSQ